MVCFLLKTKGYKGTEDFVQIRTADFALIGNVRCRSLESRLDSIIPSPEHCKKLLEAISSLPADELTKIEL